MHRAYSHAFVEIKSLSDAERVIEGTASTPRPDRMLDVVRSEGVEYKLPLPLLLDHNHEDAVGRVESAQVSAKGIKFRARIAKIETPGAAKDLTDKAWDFVSSGLRSAVSIGFRPLETDILPTGGALFKRWEWFELSLCSVPANADCTIEQIKRLDAQNRRARRDGNLTPAEKWMVYREAICLSEDERVDRHIAWKKKIEQHRDQRADELGLKTIGVRNVDLWAIHDFLATFANETRDLVHLVDGLGERLTSIEANVNGTA